MERHEAEVVYDAGREVVVEVLLRMDSQIQQLTVRVEDLERELRKSSGSRRGAVERSGGQAAIDA